MCSAHGGGGDPKGWGPDNTFFWCHKTIYIFNMSRQIWLSHWHFYRPYIERNFSSVQYSAKILLISQGNWSAELANGKRFLSWWKEDSDKCAEVCHFCEENPQRGSFGLSPLSSCCWEIFQLDHPFGNLVSITNRRKKSLWQNRK